MNVVSLALCLRTCCRNTGVRRKRLGKTLSILEAIYMAVLVGVNRIALSAINGLSGAAENPGVRPAMLPLIPVCIGELALLAGMKLLLLGPTTLAM